MTKHKLTEAEMQKLLRAARDVVEKSVIRGNIFATGDVDQLTIQTTVGRYRALKQAIADVKETES
jgi:hypothetical protein